MNLPKYIFVLILVTQLVLQNLSAETISNENGWYKADRVIATVNSEPILLSQLESRLEIEKNRKEPKNKFEIIDSFINDELLYQAAERESIIVSEKKVDSHIEELMEFYDIDSIDAFMKRIESQENVPWDVYREEVKKKLVIEQLMVYAMDYVPPTEGEAREWYEKNKKNMLQVRFQHILIKPKDDSFTAEKEANVLIEDLRERILGGESFGRLARQFSHDNTSARNNGIIGWTSFAEVDKDIVYVVYNMKNRGTVTPVFKTPSGYHIIKYLGRRYLPYDQIRDRIFQSMSQQARMDQFQDWVEGQRAVSDIKVFVEGYEEHRNTANDEEQHSDIR